MTPEQFQAEKVAVWDAYQKRIAKIHPSKIRNRPANHNKTKRVKRRAQSIAARAARKLQRVK
jgi:hypothetical protein